MSVSLLRFIDDVVDASMVPASAAIAPLVRDIESALDGADGYEAANAALRRLEGKRADGLQIVLEGAMMNGTSAGAVG